MMFLLVCGGQAFANELDNHWAEKEMIDFKTYGILQGDEQGRLLPGKVMTRGEVYTMLVKMFGEDVQSEPDEPYYTKAVDKLELFGLIDAEEIQQERIKNPMPRGEMIMLLAKAFELLEANQPSNAQAVTQLFVKEKYLVGDEQGDLKLDHPISRAEVVKIIGNIYPHVITTEDTVTSVTYKGNVWVMADAVTFKNVRFEKSITVAPSLKVTRDIQFNHTEVTTLVVPKYALFKPDFSGDNIKIKAVKGTEAIDLNGKAHQVKSGELKPVLNEAKPIGTSETTTASETPVPSLPPQKVDVKVATDIKQMTIEGQKYIVFGLNEGDYAKMTLLVNGTVVKITPVTHDGMLVKAPLPVTVNSALLKHTKGEQNLLSQTETPKTIGKEDVQIKRDGNKIALTVEGAKVDVDTVTGATTKGSTASYYLGPLPEGINATVSPLPNGIEISFLASEQAKTTAFNVVFKWLTHGFKNPKANAAQFDFNLPVALASNPSPEQSTGAVKTIIVEGVPYMIIETPSEEAVTAVHIDGQSVPFTKVNHSGSIVKVLNRYTESASIRVSTATQIFE